MDLEKVKAQRDAANRALREAVARQEPREVLQDLAHMATETSGVFWVAKLQEAMKQTPPPRRRL